MSSPDGHDTEAPKLPAGSLGSRGLLKIALEVVLISLGVFLALMGEQCRERARDRELAEASLRGFSEIVLWEPQLLGMYDELVPQIDRALGQSP